jgi:hypothetical protein
LFVCYRVSDDPSGVHYQHFTKGALVLWEAGEPQRADLIVHWSGAVQRRAFSQTLTALDLSSEPIAFSVDSLERVGLLPSDPLTLHLCRELPDYRGATVTVNYNITDGLVPGLGFMHRIENGRLRESAYRQDPKARLQVTASWDWLFEFLRGECGLLEIMNVGRIDGELFPAQVVATGVLESDEYHEIWADYVSIYDRIDEWVSLVTSQVASRLTQLIM